VVSALDSVVEWSIAASSRLGYFAALYKRITIHPRLNSRHDVVDGDTLWQLAAYYYGDTGDDGRTQTMVEMVTATNHIDDPDQLQVGQVA
jgi:nucleoid-associated protein YgaU